MRSKVRGDVRDLVTPELRIEVFERDGFACVAPRIDPTVDACRGKWGEAFQIGAGVRDLGVLTLDHIKDQMQVGAPIVKRGILRKHRYRAPSDMDHLVTACWHHHLDGWCTAHRPELREWIRTHRTVPEEYQPVRPNG